MDGALILEGGGMRGVYTAGVLDCFLDEKIDFSRVYGISAGACNALTYLSRDRGRYLRVTKAFCNDPRYVGIRQLLTKGSIFNWDFSFYTIPERYIPFNYTILSRTESELIVGATGCRDGTCTYFSNRQEVDIIEACIASSCIPMLSKPRRVNGKDYLDGGVADSIPVRKALADGCKKVVAVLTRNEGYVKKPMPAALIQLAKRQYREYPAFVAAMERRHEDYNRSAEILKQMEREGKAVVLRPSKPMLLKRVERDTQKLQAAYDNGYEDAKNALKRIFRLFSEERAGRGA